jgi:hypothetical protein
VGWTLFFMIVVLKIPMAAALWIVWWAVKQEPEPDESIGDDRPGPRRKPPRRPRSPRRGPAGGAGRRPTPCGGGRCAQVTGVRLNRRSPAHARRA